VAAVAPAHAADDPACKLCMEAQEKTPKAPLQIEIDKGIDFSRFAQVGSGGGTAAIDPQTGTKTVSGGLMSLGGFAYQGHATVTGAPNAYVRIEMPGSVALYSANGAEVELSDFRTDLPSSPMLDGSGRLEFNFGARMETRRGGGGNFRGRIPIRIEYN
jgi:hypothetical protein